MKAAYTQIATLIGLGMVLVMMSACAPEKKDADVTCDDQSMQAYVLKFPDHHLHKATAAECSNSCVRYEDVNDQSDIFMDCGTDK